MLGALREMQLPLLSALLLLACASKAARAARSRSIDEALSPTTMFPLHLRRPAAMVMCATEFSLGVMLVMTADHLVPWPPTATLVRLGTVLLFATATAALIELRAHRPDVGCGCFGDLSSSPVSLRTIARSALFTLAAAATVGVPPVRLTEKAIIPGAVHGTLDARLLVALVTVEVVLICVLSPELGEALIRLGYREPCERRLLATERTLVALHASRAWRRYVSLLTDTEPTDMWRELCWRYVVYRGAMNGRDVDVVFAVYTRRWSPPIRAAIVDAVTGETLATIGRPARPPGQDEPEPATAAGKAPVVTSSRPG